MAYIDKNLGENLIEKMYKTVKESIKNTDKLIEENNIAGYNTSYLRGVKNGKIELLKEMIIEIREYNERKKKSIYFTYTGNCSKASEWGYLLDVDIDWLDNYFVGILGMKAITESSWDNKTAERVYFFED